MSASVQLPIPEISDLPDLDIPSSDRWADMVDNGTPTPWPEDTPADFKLGTLWPDTPTPSASMEAKCFAPMKGCRAMSDQTCYPVAEMPNIIAAPAGMAFPMFAQTCPAIEKDSNMNSTVAVVGVQMQMLPHVYPQSCLAGTEMPVHCVVIGSNGLPLPQGLSQTSQAVEIPSMSAQQGWPLQPEWYAAQMNNVLGGFSNMIEWEREAYCNSSAVAYSGGHAVAMPWSCEESGKESAGHWKVGTEEVESLTKENVFESLSDTSPSQSEQSAQHISGQCKPCAWFWRPKGCLNGDDCKYCHLCPEGELKSRKKNKLVAMKMGAVAPVNAQAGN